MLGRLDKRLIAVAGVAGSLLWCATANAQTVSIGIGSSPGTISQIGSSFSGASSTGGNASGTSGNFSTNVDATGFPGLGFSIPIPLLLSNAITVQSSGAGTLYIAVTEQGLVTLPSTTGTFSSTYSVQYISGTAMTVTEQTYYDGANGLFTTPSALGTGLTTTAGVAGPNSGPSNQALSTDFSVTELFTIVATATGRTNDTINLAVDVGSGSLGTPLPAALPLFGSVLGGGFLFGKFRKRRKANAQLATA